MLKMIKEQNEHSPDHKDRRKSVPNMDAMSQGRRKSRRLSISPVMIGVEGN